MQSSGHELKTKRITFCVLVQLHQIILVFSENMATVTSDNAFPSEFKKNKNK